MFSYKENVGKQYNTPKEKHINLIFRIAFLFIYIYVKMSRCSKRFVFFLGFIYLFYSYILVCFQLVAFVREHIWHKAFLMGYSMRLELTGVCSLNGFQLVIGLHRGHSLFLSMCIP